MGNRFVGLAAIGALLLSGCSSRPRDFEPILAQKPVDQSSFDAAAFDCRVMVAAATKRGSDRLQSAAGGAAAGAGAGVAAGAATAGTTYATMGAAAAAAGAVLMTIPVFGLAGAWGVSKMKKNKKEKAIKQATAACLAERGFDVKDWRMLSKRESRALQAQARPVAAVPAPPTAPASDTAAPAEAESVPGQS